jgi:hypothetical protein
LLRLNPNDNQGICYSLLNLLVKANREAEARALLKDYEGEWTAEWLYTRALFAFRSEGASAQATMALREALGMNRHVPAYLAGRKRIPAHLPDTIALGQEDEAATYASSYLAVWRRTPGALAWLSQVVADDERRGRAKRTRRDS